MPVTTVQDPEQPETTIIDLDGTFRVATDSVEEFAERLEQLINEYVVSEEDATNLYNKFFEVKK